ncbi:MAG: hypothetical protein RR293_02130 [Bacteroidales bacterium]
MKNDEINNFLKEINEIPYSREFTNSVMSNIGRRSSLKDLSIMLVCLLWLSAFIWTWVNIDMIAISVQSLYVSLNEFKIPSEMEFYPYFIFLCVVAAIFYITVDCINNLDIYTHNRGFSDDY